MTDTNQKQLGKTLWSIADQLRGAMEPKHLSRRDIAYQPRATPWVSESAIARVLKERRIPPNGGRVTDQSRCGVPSERMADIHQTHGVVQGIRVCHYCQRSEGTPHTPEWRMCH